MSHIFDASGSNYIIKAEIGHGIRLETDSNVLDISPLGNIVINNDSGTSGQVLTSQGSSLPPIWANANATAAGSVNQIQLNNGSNALTASSEFFFNSLTGAFHVNLPPAGPPSAFLTVADINIYGASGNNGSSDINIHAGSLFVSGTGGSVELSAGSGPSSNNGELRFKTSNNTRLTIDKDGAFLLGGTSAGTVGQVLTSAGTGALPTWTSLTSTLDSVYVNVSGDTMTGSLTLDADPTLPLHAATKQYVDAVATGLDVKKSVRVATTANITLSGTQTIDGVLLIAGDRVLVKDQTTGSENGIYDVASGAWTRSSDADVSAEVTAGMFTFVSEGTTNGDKGWVLATNDPITLGTTSLSFTQFSGAGGGSVAGSNQQVQFNNGGAFGADADFFYISASNDLRIGGLRLQQATGSGAAFVENLNTDEMLNIQAVNGTSSRVRVFAANSFQITTNSVQRLRIANNGAWLLTDSELAGTTGQVLTSNGSGAAPSWQTVSGASATINQVVLGTGTGITSDSHFTYDPSTGGFGVNSSFTTGSTAQVTIRGASSNTGSGAAVIISGGNSTGLQSGGQVQISGGTGGNSNGGGGQIFITAGSSGTSGAGGNLTLTAGQGVFPSTGGFIILKTGLSSATTRLTIDDTGAWLLAGTSAGTSGQVLTSNGTGTPPTWTTVSGGSATPAGSSTQIQFNNAGTFGASSAFTFNSGTTILGVGALSIDGSSGIMSSTTTDVTLRSSNNNVTLSATNGTVSIVTAGSTRIVYQNSGTILYGSSTVSNFQDATIQQPVLKDYAETKTSPTISAGAITLDIANGNTFDLTLTANITSMTISNPPPSGTMGSITIVLKQDATGGRTVTWPGSVKWSGGISPTLTTTGNKTDIVTLMTVDSGITWFGLLVGLNF